MEKMLKKGSEIAVEGKLLYHNYEDKEGKKKSITEVVVDEFLILGPRRAGA
jgi:single-strand DNA-binding protein